MEDASLSLSELFDFVSAKTYEWLQRYEKKEEVETTEAPVSLLFDDDNVDEEPEQRVKQWTSSTSNPNGIGGYDKKDDSDSPNIQGDSLDDPSRTTKSSSVTVDYILSEAPGGHGDEMWAASRLVSNLFADPVQCRALLQFSAAATANDHPLVGASVLELGAGAGLPSWVAAACGATTVLCTDQPIPQRIQCLAEAAQRNSRRIQPTTGGQPTRIRVCPYLWGDPVDTLLNDHNHGERFNVIVAADCIYNHKFHDPLLQSIQNLLHKSNGVALFPFALHGNTNDDNIWAIRQLASINYGLAVETLPPTQLCPQIASMDPKRGLVHMLRLTWARK